MLQQPGLDEDQNGEAVTGQVPLVRESSYRSPHHPLRVSISRKLEPGTVMRPSQPLAPALLHNKRACHSHLKHQYSSGAQGRHLVAAGTGRLHEHRSTDTPTCSKSQIAEPRLKPHAPTPNAFNIRRLGDKQAALFPLNHIY